MRTYEIINDNSGWLIPLLLAVGATLTVWSIERIIHLVREKPLKGPTRIVETHDGPEAPF